MATISWHERIALFDGVRRSQTSMSALHSRHAGIMQLPEPQPQPCFVKCCAATSCSYVLKGTLFMTMFPHPGGPGNESSASCTFFSSQPSWPWHTKGPVGHMSPQQPRSYSRPATDHGRSVKKQLLCFSGMKTVGVYRGNLLMLSTNSRGMEDKVKQFCLGMSPTRLKWTMAGELWVQSHSHWALLLVVTYVQYGQKDIYTQGCLSDSIRNTTFVCWCSETKTNSKKLSGVGHWEELSGVRCKDGKNVSLK